MSGFVVGLTNNRPDVVSPVTGGYNLCGSGPAKAVSIMPVICQLGLLPARYVVIIVTAVALNFCELLVFGTG